MSTDATPGFEAIKARHRLAWGLDVEAYVRHTVPELAPVAERMVELASPTWGASVLDAACGPGTLTVMAARAVGPGGRVVGLDLAPPMLAHAERTAGKLGLDHVRFIEGDVEELAGLGEGSFDHVFSNFGLIFAPSPERAIAQIARVLRPGGHLTFSTWVPVGVVAETFELLAGLVPPPPPDAAAPESWGRDGVAGERLAPWFDAIELQPHVVMCDYPSVDQAWLRMKEGRPPFALAYMRLGPEERQAVEERAREMFRRHADAAGRVRYERQACIVQADRRLSGSRSSGLPS